MAERSGETELIRVTGEDLRHLLSRGDKLDNPSVRRDSIILRRLLVEGDFFRTWKVLGFRDKPRVVAPRLEYFLDRKATRRRIHFALAGGGQYFGVLAAMAIINVGSEAVQLDPEVNPLEFTFTISEFARSASIYVEGVTVSRTEVIQYVANKLGGAHVSSGRKGTHGRTFEVLDRNTDRFFFEGIPKLHGTNAVFFELLSIGQLLVKSHDVQRVLAIIDRALRN